MMRAAFETPIAKPARRRSPAWAWGSFLVACAMATPILAVLLTAAAPGGEVWRHIMATTLPEMLANSALLALLVALMAGSAGAVAAWLVVACEFRGRRLLEFMTMLSFAIPGTVVGVSYIMAFNVPPVELTGTALILILCFVFRNLPVGVRGGIAALAQIDRSLDEASATMGASAVQTLRRSKPRHIPPFDHDAADIGQFEARDQPESRRLAAARWPEQRHQGTAREGKAYLIHGAHGAEAFCHFIENNGIRAHVRLLPWWSWAAARRRHGAQSPRVPRISRSPRPPPA